ncbi:hypothetical protein D9V32_02680 [Mycetocola tolaasinivorans]|uniref:DUF7507 domain-containing protein n=1 Tax=Mycetocola tolaasinivorans TaxID=76635 RepID=A0A3L7AAP4_9MICO|nr:hypothetical protein [Mycetocola tolaasinivorans]RLP77373.1 hypothetical protein D9V32_02680 [Mycetocola tolaasinivorans]
MAKISGRWATAASVLSLGVLLGVTTTLPASAAPMPVPSASVVAEDDTTETGSESTDPSVVPSASPSETTEADEPSSPVPTPEVSIEPTRAADVPEETDTEAEPEEGNAPGQETEEGPWGDYGLEVTPTWIIEDTNGNGLLDVGERFGYSFEVKNLTDLDLTNLTVNQIHPAYPWDTPGPSVAAGETVTLTETWVYSQIAFDFRVPTQTGTVSGAENETTESYVVRGISANDKGVYSSIQVHDFPLPVVKPAVTSVATVTSTETPRLVGDVINYSVVVTNSGNATLAEPALASPANTTGGAERAYPIDYETVRGVAPGESRTLTGTHIVGAADIARGSAIFTVNATSQSMGEFWVLSAPQTLTVKLDPAVGGLADTGSDLSSVVPGIAVLVLAAGVGLLGLKRRRASVDGL